MPKSFQKPHGLPLLSLLSVLLLQQAALIDALIHSLHLSNICFGLDVQSPQGLRSTTDLDLLVRGVEDRRSNDLHVGLADANAAYAEPDGFVEQSFGSSVDHLIWQFQRLEDQRI